MKQISTRIARDNVKIAELITRIWGQNHQIPPRWGVTKVYRMAIDRGLTVLLKEAQETQETQK